MASEEIVPKGDIMQLNQPNEQESKQRRTVKIALIIVVVLAFYGVLQIINASVNKDEPPATFAPNRIEDTTE